MLRRTPLERGKPIRRRPKAPMSDEDKAYVGWLHSQRCIVSELSSDPCDGPIHAAHQDEGKGEGLKTGWETCIPLCARHHLACWGEARPPFDGSRESRRLHHRALLHIVRGRYEGRSLAKLGTYEAPF